MRIWADHVQYVVPLCGTASGLCADHKVSRPRESLISAADFGMQLR
jgi:hypothetical protein